MQFTLNEMFTVISALGVGICMMFGWWVNGLQNKVDKNQEACTKCNIDALRNDVEKIRGEISDCRHEIVPRIEHDAEIQQLYAKIERLSDSINAKLEDIFKIVVSLQQHQ